MNKQREQAYERILERVETALEKAEETTFEGIKREIDEAIELEEDVEELTRQEVSLLGAYLKRDLENLRGYLAETGKGVAEWLRFDINLLERRLVNLLLSVADKTLVARHQLEEELAERKREDYEAGEYVLPGTFLCENCKAEQEFIKPGILEDCAECGGDRFLRSSDE